MSYLYYYLLSVHVFDLNALQFCFCCFFHQKKTKHKNTLFQTLTKCPTSRLSVAVQLTTVQMDRREAENVRNGQCVTAVILVTFTVPRLRLRPRFVQWGGLTDREWRGLCSFHGQRYRRTVMLFYTVFLHQGCGRCGWVGGSCSSGVIASGAAAAGAATRKPEARCRSPAGPPVPRSLESLK